MWEHAFLLGVFSIVLSTEGARMQSDEKIGTKSSVAIRQLPQRQKVPPQVLRQLCRLHVPAWAQLHYEGNVWFLFFIQTANLSKLNRLFDLKKHGVLDQHSQIHPRARIRNKYGFRIPSLKHGSLMAIITVMTIN